MILTDVMDELGDALETIPGLNVHRWPVDSLTPPSGIVQFPEINYDQSFGRGTDRMNAGIVVAVSQVWNEAARANLAPYVDGSGAKSVHAALLAYTTGKLWTSCSYARVIRVSFPQGGYVVGGLPYVAAQFDLDISGRGS